MKSLTGDVPVIDRHPQVASNAGWCRCRPGCLASYAVGDLVVHTTAGFIVIEHTQAVAS